MPFIKDVFLPFVDERGHAIAEIVSDYRAADGSSVCVPGQWGYQSIIPAEMKHAPVWVKAEPSQAWVREGGGQANRLPGLPYPDPDSFTAWLNETIGPPDPQNEIIIVGLTFEICVLSTLQELHHRCYQARLLFEGVDTYSGSVEQKLLLCETFFPFWGQPIHWHDLSSRF